MGNGAVRQGAYSRQERAGAHVGSPVAFTAAEVDMALSVLSRLLFVLVAGLTLGACELAGDIFQAGMAVGIFIIIAVVALVIFLMNKVRRRV